VNPDYIHAASWMDDKTGWNRLTLEHITTPDLVRIDLTNDHGWNYVVVPRRYWEEMMES